MIELNISTSEAVTLLTARMFEEKKLRERAKLLPKGTKLTALPFEELLSIAETAAFDLVILLPLDVFMEESNLPLIITKAIRELARIFGKKEFGNYAIENAKKLLSPIVLNARDFEGDEKFKLN
jgi:hypothetical protein